MRLLLAEDEQSLSKALVAILEGNHYSVDAVYDGVDALAYLDAGNYDALILDIMMPKLDGISVLKKFRASGSSTPVLFLTAKDAVSDRVQGLDAGADDYLVKPFSFDELLARIRVLLRRNTGNAENVLRAANLTVDLNARTVFRDSTAIALSSKEFSILEYMVRNQGIVLTREKIEQHIWNYDYEGGSNVIDVYIRYLRKKIDDSYTPKLIHTVRGTGYVLKEINP